MMSWLPLDPAGELAKVSAPVMVVQGTHDLQIGTGDAERLKAARPDAELLLIDGMNHVLRDAPMERAGNLALYARRRFRCPPRSFRPSRRFYYSISSWLVCHPGIDAPACDVH